MPIRNPSQHQISIQPSVSQSILERIHQREIGVRRNNLSGLRCGPLSARRPGGALAPAVNPEAAAGTVRPRSNSCPFDRDDVPAEIGGLLFT